MTAIEVFANNASTIITAGGNTSPTAGTSETWTAASPGAFPAASNSASPPTQFRLFDPAQPSEEMICTNVSGSAFTVTRGAEGTTPVAHGTSFTVYCVLTSGALKEFAQVSGGDIGGTGQAPQVTGTHLASPMPLAQGGTAAATQQAALDTLAGAVSSHQVLAGNGTHVTLRALTATDLPAFPADQPWQFRPETYGAKGDGRVVGDGAMTTGTATLTSATAAFTSGDVGKNVIVNGALGASNAPLYTTIASVTNATTAVLSATASNTVTSAGVFWASDDSAAFAAAMAAGSAYAQANNWKFQLVCEAKWYGLATLTTTTAGGSLAQQNTLVPIPYPTVAGTSQKLIVEMVGVGEAADEQYFGSTVPSMTGTALVATVAASGTAPSIVGGPSASTNLTGTWANTKLIAKGITVWAGFNPGWIGWDLHQLSACWIDSAGAQVFAPAGGGQNPGLGNLPVNTSGIGLYLPANNDNGAGRVMVEGYYQGVSLSPRSTIEKLFTSTTAIGVLCRTVNSTVTHGARIGYWSCNIATTAISSTGTSGTMPLVVDLFDSAGTITTDLSDPHGTIVGSLNWWHTVSTGPAVAAGFAMRIVNLRLNPGPMASPPASPSSAVASTPVFRDTEVTLSITGGSMTALLIDAVDQHIPAGCVLWKITLPSGHTYTPTYTGTLATDVTVM